VEDAVSMAFPFVKVVVKTTKGLTLAETPINSDGSACWKLESRTGSVIGKWPRELQQVRVWASAQAWRRALCGGGEGSKGRLTLQRDSYQAHERNLPGGRETFRGACWPL